MQIRLDPSSEQVIQQQLRSGRYASAEDVVAHALDTLARQEPQQSEKDRAQAIDEMLGFAHKHGFKLAGLGLRQLRHEGHKR